MFRRNFTENIILNDYYPIIELAELSCGIIYIILTFFFRSGSGELIRWVILPSNNQVPFISNTTKKVCDGGKLVSPSPVLTFKSYSNLTYPNLTNL